MNLGTPVLDLSSVVAALASFGGVAGLLSMLRILFLDRLLSGLDTNQQNVLLRGANVLLNFLAILGLSMLLGMPFGQPLLLSTLLATLGAAGGSHLVYTGAKTAAAKQASAPQDVAPASVPTPYPVYPPETIAAN